MSSRAGDVGVLARYGFRAPERVLDELPPRWRDDPDWNALLDIAGQVADPDAAIRRLRRLGDDIVERAVRVHERAGPLLRAIGYSEYLTDLLARTPGLAGELLGDAVVERTDLREFRDARFVWIAAADLGSQPTRDSFHATAVALTELADECVRRVLDGTEPGPIAVMAMGKYGASELNYASDIDVLFAAPDDDVDAATRAARRVIEVMNGPPVLFRVDADLRPEGRDGPLVRSLDAYRAYYERWAQVWEFQSLIKCRFAAGAPEIGAAFHALIEPHVWPDTLSPDAIEQVRALKARAELQVSRSGRADRQVKLGPGGIRDVEFAVQLLQLVHGRHHPELRIRSTLGALDILGAEGFVAPDDVRELVDAYVFLRHVEHRLQLEAGRQTHTLPDAPAKREHLARGLGFTDGPSQTALASFEDVWSRTTGIVRTIHERLFYRPLMEAFASVPSVRPTLSEEEADERLAALGFDRPPRVRQTMAKMTAGASRRAKMLRALLPGLLAWMAETPDADAGMVRLASVADQLDELPHLLGVLRDEPPVAELLCRALGTGPVLAALLERDPSLIASLSETERQEADARSQALAITARARDASGAVSALRRFKDGEVLRLAARDLVSGEGPDVFSSVSSELSDVADACLEAALAIARDEQAARTNGAPPGGFAVIAMGRLGGRELSYASDLDVVFIYEQEGACPDGTDARLFHSAVAERIIGLLGSTPPVFKVDAELRPEGRSGAIVRSFNGYRVYYERYAALWEFQALTRARHAAGDRALTEALLDTVAPRVWRGELDAAELSEIRHIKARIERERVKGRDDARYQVKLGVGGLADVEFTVQLQQMRYGAEYWNLRSPNTLEAIGTLRAEGLIAEQDAEWLRDAYLLLNRVRNHMWLLRGLATDTLPTQDEDLEKLARSLGYGRLSRTRFLETYRRTTRRARRVTDRLFYGED